MTDPMRFSASGSGNLTGEMRAAYERDGFLLLENFVGSEDCNSLLERMTQLVDTFDPATLKTVFDTSEQGHARNRYFRESGDKIRFFFEPGAFDASGALIADKHQALNKVGHALHDLDPVFDGFCRCPQNSALVAGLGLTDPGLIQSMFMFKSPRIGGEVTWHQDATFLSTQPETCVGLWFALEDATIENGCLYGLPGAHLGGVRQRYGYDEAGELIMDVLDPAPWPEEAQVALQAPRGTLIVLHGAAPHCSGPNLSAKPRRAFALHVIDRAAHWRSDNWLTRSANMPVRGF
ncbi:MAG: phytanoyl-CoA dioxygenase family protein [Hyphomicrobiales bacterium]